jgi:propanediol utilization protein
LGIDPPVRLSGTVAGTPGAVLEGSAGTVELTEGVICARRHIHMTPEDAARYGIRDGECVNLKVFGSRPVIFEQVPVRISRDFQTRVHLDFDEANACGFRKGDLGRILQ